MKFSKFCSWTGGNFDCRDCANLWLDRWCFAEYLKEFKKALKKG